MIVKIPDNMGADVCTINFGGCWDSFYCLGKFTYNNIYNSNVEMTSLRHCKKGCLDIQFIGLRLEM